MKEKKRFEPGPWRTMYKCPDCQDLRSRPTGFGFDDGWSQSYCCPACGSLNLRATVVVRRVTENIPRMLFGTRKQQFWEYLE